MCGLIAGTGVIESRYLVALGCLAEDRGSDSAGVAWQAGERLRIAKVAKNPLVAYPVDLAPAIRHAAKYHAPVIGHTRQATQGAVTSRNAHPFLDEKAKIAWAHNGIILNDKDFGKFEVDSECLIGGIQKRDFSPYQGPIALLWIENGKLHAFRKHNPLFRGVKRGAVYLASEAGMLAAIGCHRVKALSEGFIYAWNKNTLESTTKVKIHEYSTTTNTRTGAWNNEDFDWDNRCGRIRHAGYRDGHGYYRVEDKQFHNHPMAIAYDYDCRGCNPLGGKGLVVKEEVTEAGTIVTPPTTHLVPTRHGATGEESQIERVEGEEAARMLDEENICLKCKVAPRAGASVWCDECLATTRQGWH